MKQSVGGKPEDKSDVILPRHFELRITCYARFRTLFPYGVLFQLFFCTRVLVLFLVFIFCVRMSNFADCFPPLHDSGFPLAVR
jgi:hypothetical protein